MTVAIGSFGPATGRAEGIKIATWNLDWLTTRPTGDPALPADVARRSDADFTTLEAWAARLDADVVAIEEVDGPVVAARLFPPDRYQVLITGDDVVQRVGLAVRRGIAVTRHPDVTALDVAPHARHRLRSGLDATLDFGPSTNAAGVTAGGGTIRVLAVHLKSGCWTPAEDREKRRACSQLREQIPVIAAWISSREAEGVPFAVLGDFNRALVAGDPVLAALDPAHAIVDPDAGLASPCWGGENFIDHVLLGGPAATWLVPGSLRVQTYGDADPAMKDRLSDHCPVSVRLLGGPTQNIPSSPPPPPPSSQPPPPASPPPPNGSPPA